DRETLDVLLRRVERLQPRVPREHVLLELGGRARAPTGGHVAGLGSEVAAHDGREAEPLVVLQPYVGSAEAALGVAADTPGRAGWHDSQVAGGPVGDLAGKEGHVHRATRG